MIYADYAATAPLRTAAKNAMVDCFELYGNPSSLHKAGKAAAEQIENARKDIAQRLNCRPNELFFTSGGTEANNWVLQSSLRSADHIVTSAVEHHAILNTLKQMDCDAAYTIPTQDGLIDPLEVEKHIQHNTRLISIMAANNEIGTIQPIEEIAKIARKRGIVFHTDAVQAIGHIPFDVQKIGVDALSLSGHKFGGPKGIGLLYCRKRTSLRPLMCGGGQERGRRAGTENTIGIVAMAAALRDAYDNMDKGKQQVITLRNRLIAEILKMPGGRVFGSLDCRLPGNVNCAVGSVSGEVLTLLLDSAGICVSAGAACSSGDSERSHVLTALGLSTHEISSAVRISLGEQNTAAEIDCIISNLNKIAHQTCGKEGA